MAQGSSSKLNRGISGWLFTEESLNTSSEEAKTPEAPLAVRMRPQSLEDFVGQEHIVGPGTPLRHMIETDHLVSCIFYGPPGCGKTSLAELITHSTQAYVERYSAVTSGIPEMREVISKAKIRRLQGRRTLLFIDEIHRFNKAQQDAFLPYVEDGTLILIGATTENPFFELNPPLLSRCRLYTFRPLTPEEILQILQKALKDPQKGLGKYSLTAQPEALNHLADIANGDVRTALNGLEMSAYEALNRGSQEITLPLVEQVVQKRSLRYDKAGDQHYDCVSAFIKSMRGSDPDATVYWLNRMLDAGEDPRFLARRMIIHAAEDVGLADPMALVVAVSAAHALEFVGMPEARIPLTEAALYIACAPKSNSVVRAIALVEEDLEKTPNAPVPPHLRDASYPGAKRLGSGEGYLYPHNFPGGWVKQQYLPDPLTGKRYYQPSSQGREAKIKEQRERLKDQG